jgi:hypothetical protein
MKLLLFGPWISCFLAFVGPPDMRGHITDARQPLSLARSSPATARHASLLGPRRGHLVRGVVRRR